MCLLDHICVSLAVLHYEDITKSCIATQAQLASANTFLLMTWTDSVQMNSDQFESPAHAIIDNAIAMSDSEHPFCPVAWLCMILPISLI